MSEPRPEKPISNGALATRLVAFAAMMFAFGFFALPPLYEVFCEITGFGGRTNSTAIAASEQPDLEREVRIVGRAAQGEKAR